MLKFESKQDTKHHGIIRFKLTKMHQRKEFYKLFNIELVVDINITEELPPSVQKFPWAYTLTNSALTTCESMQNSDIVKDPAQVRLSQRHCQSGDYLTIYTRGLAHPVIKRKTLFVCVLFSNLIFLKGMETILGCYGRTSVTFV